MIFVGETAPVNPKSDALARANDPTTFASYENAFTALMNRYGQFEGLGLGIFRTIAGIDIDNCAVYSENGKLTLGDAAADIIDKFSTYAELSPSKTGVHLYFQVPPEYAYDTRKYYIKNPENSIEIYCPSMTSRYLTLTGYALNNNTMIADEAMIIKAMEYTLDKYMLRPSQSTKTAHAAHSPQHSTALDKPKRQLLSDNELIEIASRAQNSSKFNSLWSGSIDGYSSQSEADLALCNILAFYSGGEGVQIERLFKQSGLYRDKWDRPGYRSQTIQKAIEICNGNFYDKHTKRNVSTVEEAASLVYKENNNRDREADRKEYPPYFTVNYDRFGKEIVKLDTSELSSYIYEKGILSPVEYALMRTEKGKGLMYLKNKNDSVWHVEIGNEMESHIRRMITPYCKSQATNGSISSTYKLLYKEPLAEEYIEPESINANERYVIFQNGALDLETMSFQDSIPQQGCFYTIKLPCEYRQDANKGEALERAPVFMSFLHRLTGGDKETMKFLLQYMGVALSNIHGYRMKKWLLLYGEGNTGKSQIMLLLQKLLGSRNYATVDLDRL
ncbi:MAG: hypothetical protein FWG30_01395, partial [Eubacteriaceae bacterium]|nr:hypothetical protein [Eubacteriaceae bacterium]